MKKPTLEERVERLEERLGRICHSCERKLELDEGPICKRCQHGDLERVDGELRDTHCDPDEFD